MTLQDLAEEFLKNYCERRLKPATVRGYRVNLKNHALAGRELLDVQQLTVNDLDELTDELLAKGLSKRSTVYIHATLRKMLNFALRRCYIKQNPYDLFDMPKVPKYRHRVLPEGEMKRMLECSRGSSLHIPITLALCYGLRRGECLGIIPSEDLAGCILHVQRTRSVEHRQEVITDCKSEDSNRYILLKEEHAQLLKKSARRGRYACELTPNQLESRFKSFLIQHEFANVRFHDLRHSYATLMLAKGVELKIISDVLGHSDLSITADTYCHPDVSVQQRCLDVF